MTTVSLASSKPPITLTSARGITITIDRSVNTSSGGGSGTVTSVTGTAPVVITGTPTTVPNVTLSGINATQTTAGIFSPARLASGTADSTTFLRGDSTWTDDVPLQVSVKNTSGGALTKGTPVYATGTVGSTAVIEIAAADASVSAKMPAIGLLLQDLAVNATGLVMVMGTITAINTAGYSINSPMYVAPGGGLTATRPTASTDLVQNVARVTRVNASTGSVLVLGPGRSNDVPNLIATNFLATSGTASATTFLRGDQSWSTAVTSVGGTAPISSSGGATPAISIAAVTTVAAGSMSATDKLKLDGIGTGATITAVTGTAPIVSSGGAAPAISVTTGFAASTVAAGNDARIISTPIYVTQQYTANTSNASTTSGIVSNRLYYLPYLITTSTTFDRIAIEHLGTVGGALSVVRLGIYSSTSSLPSTLVLDAGTIDLTTAIAFKTITINQTLTPGLYFLAVVAQVTSGTPTFRTAPPAIVTPDTANINSGVKFEAASGTLPSTATPGVSNTTTVPIAWMRKT